MRGMASLKIAVLAAHYTMPSRLRVVNRTYQYFGKHKITVPVAPPDKCLHTALGKFFPLRQSLPEFKIVLN